MLIVLMKCNGDYIGLNRIEVPADRAAVTMRPIKALGCSPLSFVHWNIMGHDRQPDGNSTFMKN